MALSRITNYIEADGADLNLQSSDTTITASSVLGVINFKAPSEASGTDAILLASKIEAVAEGTFSASSNATKLSFATASSEAAAEKMALSSGGDLSIVTDGASIFFGADSEIELRHVADDGLIIKHVGTGDGKEPSLTFQAGDNDIAQDDVLGQINFQAPDEGAGTDAVLIASTIKAFSEGDFSSSNNATTLELSTGRSAAAGSDGGRLRLTSAGALELKSQNTADGSSPTITLQTGDTDIAQDDVLGTINFQAPDEGTGTDAILVAASISSISEGDFSSSSNATSLIFKTGSSEAAAEKVRLTSAGLLKVVGDGSTTTNALTVGAGDDLKIFHGGTNSEIVNGTGALILKGDDIAMNSAGGESMFSALSNDMVRLYFDNTEALRTTSGGGITIANGLTLTDGDIAVADGHGLSFAATGDASSSGFSELLDDYEEGVAGTTIAVSTAGSVTLNGSYNNIRYTKIGRLATMNGDLRVSSVSSPQGSFRINIPFTSLDAPHASTAVNLGLILTHSITKQTGQQGNFVILSGDNLSYLTIQYDTASTRLGLQAENMGLGASDEVVFSITMTTA